MQEVRVIHFSNSVKGGAGIAAHRLNQALNAEGIDSLIYSLDQVSSETEIRLRRNIFRLVIGKMNSLIAGRISKRTFISSVSVSAISVKHLMAKIRPEDVILHIHNWFNFFSIEDIFELLKNRYKIVFTLHDERLLTGGCHYSLNCREFENSCSKCPEISHSLQILPRHSFKKFYKLKGLNNVQFNLIAPSKWIAGEAKKSRLLNEAKIYVIQNSLGDFVNLPSVNAEKLSIESPGSRIRLGVASMNPSSYIKGGDLLQKLIHDKEFQENFDILYLSSYIPSEKLNFWRDIDFLFVPSRIDNSPNVIHEAKSLGIPVIGTKVGGIVELLDPETDYLLDIPQINPSFLVENKDIFNKILGNKIGILDSQNRFKYWSHQSAINHIKLYEEILNCK